jgi:diguanylate cyclase (GGDEF)-like protein/PAS domain S-box-containing protein
LSIAERPIPGSPTGAGNGDLDPDSADFSGGDNIDLMASLMRARAELAAVADSHERLMEAEETLRAIRHGEVDALVVSDSAPGEQVFTLSSADRPYRIFVENMQEGAATLSSAGVVLFANTRLGELLGCPAEDIVASQMAEFIADTSRAELLAAIGSALIAATLEVRLQRPDGGAVAVLAGISRLDVDDERLTCLTFTDLTSEQDLLQEVRASQQRFEALYKGAPVPAYTWQHGSAGLILIDYNDAAAQLTGGRVVEALGSNANVYYRHEPDLLSDLTRCLTKHVVVERATVSHEAGDGEPKHLQVTMVPVPPDLVVVHAQDVTEQWVAERELRTSEERYRSIFENAQEGISILDERGLFTFTNRRTAELLGHDVSALTGMKASQLLGSTITWAPTEPGVPDSAQYAVTATRPDGSLIDLLVSTAPILLSGSDDVGSLCMMSDVSGLRLAEEKLAHLALHDALTGLPNRTLLMDRIDQALARGSRQTSLVAALFCDLDGFKEINDSFGHHVGDDTLKAVAARLRAAVRPTDTVARIGGDEFVVLCEGMVDESAAFGVASRVLASIAEPLEVAGHELPLSVSVGVAFDFSGDSAELLRNADAAMYLAKQRGRNRAELFDEQLRRVAAARLSLLADLRHAEERRELRLHYQPVFSLDGEHLQGVEALVRWEHPKRGLLYPDEFVSAAEGANLIGSIGAWVLRTACRQAAMWSGAGAGGLPLHMAVNVSAKQLAQGSGLVQLVADALADAEIDPATLVLEVTESVVMDDAEATLAILTELKALGVKLAIDDFGTGYSSLVYLKRFPVDQLKIDRSFVSGLGSDPDDSAIVASVVGLARAVGIVAIAEGVETAEQLAALQQLGCALGQGYLWSRPVPASEFDRLHTSDGFATVAVGTFQGPLDMSPEEE